MIDRIGLIPEAVREINRLSDEAQSLLLLLFFARYRGWRRPRAGGKVSDLDGDLDDCECWGRVAPENLPGPLRRAWEAIAP